MAADYYNCKEIVERQDNIAKKREERRAKKEIKKVTRKMYRKRKDEHRLPFRFSWSLAAYDHAKSLGFELYYTKFGFKLKNKTLYELDNKKF